MSRRIVLGAGRCRSVGGRAGLGQPGCGARATRRPARCGDHVDGGRVGGRSIQSSPLLFVLIDSGQGRPPRHFVYFFFCCSVPSVYFKQFFFYFYTLARLPLITILLFIPLFCVYYFQSFSLFHFFSFLLLLSMYLCICLFCVFLFVWFFC